MLTAPAPDALNLTIVHEKEARPTMAKPGKPARSRHRKKDRSGECAECHAYRHLPTCSNYKGKGHPERRKGWVEGIKVRLNGRFDHEGRPTVPVFAVRPSVPIFGAKVVEDLDVLIADLEAKVVALKAARTVLVG